MTEICSENASDTGLPGNDPCLRMKGHSGKHIHDALCVDPCCCCMGYDKKIFKVIGRKIEVIVTKEGYHIR